MNVVSAAKALGYLTYASICEIGKGIGLQDLRRLLAYLPNAFGQRLRKS
jgi:hypothetical protein